MNAEISETISLVMLIENIYIHGVGNVSPSLRCKLLTEIIILSARVFKYIYSEVV